MIVRAMDGRPPEDEGGASGAIAAGAGSLG